MTYHLGQTLRVKLLYGERITADDKTAHRPLKVRYARWFDSRLKAGCLAAHVRFRLMLLGSPPDMVHEVTLRKTGSSTLLIEG